MIYSVHLPQDSNRIGLRELALCGDPFEEFSARGKFEREIILGPRLEPFVELDLTNV